MATEFAELEKDFLHDYNKLKGHVDTYFEKWNKIEFMFPLCSDEKMIEKVEENFFKLSLYKDETLDCYSINYDHLINGSTRRLPNERLEPDLESDLCDVKKRIKVLEEDLIPHLLLVETAIHDPAPYQEPVDEEKIAARFLHREDRKIETVKREADLFLHRLEGVNREYLIMLRSGLGALRMSSEEVENLLVICLEKFTRLAPTLTEFQDKYLTPVEPIDRKEHYQGLVRIRDELREAVKEMTNVTIPELKRRNEPRNCQTEQPIIVSPD